MWNARLDEAQTGIKIAGRNTSNVRYADDTALMSESKEELKSLLMKVKEESEKPGLKLNFQKKKKKTQLSQNKDHAIDGSPPGSQSLGFSRQEHWSGLPFPSPMHKSEKWKVKVKSLSHVRLLATPWTAAYQSPPSMGFSGQEYWSGLPLPSPN